MLQEERLQRIEEYVRQRKFCSLQEIAEKFNISKATARRDLKQLHDRNRLAITRGGAADLTAGTAFEAPYTVKKTIDKDEKHRIARKACSLINRGETIIIDSGTTSYEMAGVLQNMKGITVATNDILVAGRLASAGIVDLSIIGGDIRKGYYSTLGYFAQSTLEQMNADKAFIGVDAIDLDKGCMITNAGEVTIKKLIMKASKEKIIICSHSKFQNAAFINLCKISEIDMIITGSELDKNIYTAFQENGVNILLA